MTWKRMPVRLVMVLAFALLVATSALALAQDTPAEAAFTPVAAGLNNPRHLDFDANGVLYVAEAGSGGSGPCVQGPEGDDVCIGSSGAVTTVQPDGTQDRLVSDLVSLATQEGSQATGPHDVAWDADGNLMVIVGLGADPAVRDPSGPLGPLGQNLGQLVEVASDGSWTNVVDVAAYEAAENPAGGPVDSNPYAVLAVDDGFVVADAGANALLHIDGDDGTITTLAVFPPRMVEFPPGSGQMIPMESVPTSVAQGSDGALYVGELTGFPFPQGGARIYRIEDGQAPEVWAEGFTNIVDLAIDDADNLYVVEIATNSLLSGDPTGAVKRVSPDKKVATIASAGLVMPGGVAVGPDGWLYVSNFGAMSGIGQVIRLPMMPMVYLPIIFG